MELTSRKRCKELQPGSPINCNSLCSDAVTPMWCPLHSAEDFQPAKEYLLPFPRVSHCQPSRYMATLMSDNITNSGHQQYHWCKSMCLNEGGLLDTTIAKPILLLVPIVPPPTHPWLPSTPYKILPEEAGILNPLPCRASHLPLPVAASLHSSVRCTLQLLEST